MNSYQIWFHVDQASVCSPQVLVHLNFCLKRIHSRFQTGPVAGLKGLRARWSPSVLQLVWLMKRLEKAKTKSERERERKSAWVSRHLNKKREVFSLFLYIFYKYHAKMNITLGQKNHLMEKNKCESD